jgi:acyl-CoA thioester hydrolase
VSEYRFYYPIEIRYGDLDPQGHVNNARYLTYIEQARIAYVRELGMWDGKSFLDIGIILAEASVSYKAAILWGQKIRVGVRVSRFGNKSFDWAYVIEDSETGKLHATAATVQVAYNYHKSKTIPIPPDWRRIITKFEGLDK